MSLAIPVQLSFETTTHHDDDQMVHHLTICVAGSSRSEVAADVVTQCYDHPRIDVVCANGLELDRARLQRFMLATYDLLLAQKIRYEARALSMMLADGRRWLNDVLDRDDARVIRAKLRQFVRPGTLVRDYVCVTP